MSDVIEVYGGTNDNDNNNEKLMRLPTLKKWLQSEHEGLWCSMLDLVLVVGVACECTKVKDDSTNQ